MRGAARISWGLPRKDGAMRTNLSPGVYRVPLPPVADDVRLVRTDIAGFVGYAERGPVAPPFSKNARTA